MVDFGMVWRSPCDAFVGPGAGGPQGNWISAAPLLARVPGVSDLTAKILPELRVPLILPAAPRPPAPGLLFKPSFPFWLFLFASKTHPRASKSLQEAIQNRISFSASFFDGFWLQLGPNLPPTWSPNPSKITAKSPPKSIPTSILSSITFL